MNTALCVMAHKGAAEAVRVCCPYWLKSGMDLIGLENCDSQLDCWPECFKEVVETLIDPVLVGTNEFHPRRMAGFISQCAMLDYDRLIITEADSIILGNPSGVKWDDESLGAFVAGTCPPAWNCGDGLFLHPPFVASSDVVLALHLEGLDAIRDGDFGNGTPDVFMGILCKRAGIKIYQPDGVWSTNGLDMRMGSKLQAARGEVNNGAWHIHGIKRKDHLDFIMGQTNDWPKDVIWE